MARNRSDHIREGDERMASFDEVPFNPWEESDEEESDRRRDPLRTPRGRRPESLDFDEE